MTKLATRRYPGANPFTDTAMSRKVFCGRDKEIELLSNQVMANHLVVLFARSGLGKTSLMNAGIAHKLRQNGYFPLSVRVNDTKNGPHASLYDGIEEACRRRQIEHVPGLSASLWHYFKTTQFWRDDLLLTPAVGAHNKNAPTPPARALNTMRPSGVQTGRVSGPGASVRRRSLLPSEFIT